MADIFFEQCYCAFVHKDVNVMDNSLLVLMNFEQIQDTKNIVGDKNTLDILKIVSNLGTSCE